MVTTYDAQGNPIQESKDIQQGQNDFIARMKRGESPASEQPKKLSTMDKVYASMKNLVMPKPSREQNYLNHLKREHISKIKKAKVEQTFAEWKIQQSMRGARKIEKRFSNMRQTARGMAGYIFPTEQAQRYKRRRMPRMPRNIQNMPAGLRNYYYNLQQSQQGQSQNQTLSHTARRQGASPSPSQYRQMQDYQPQRQPEVSLLNHNIIRQPKEQKAPEAFLQPAPDNSPLSCRRKSKIGVDSNNNHNGW